MPSMRSSSLTSASRARCLSSTLEAWYPMPLPEAAAARGARPGAVAEERLRAAFQSWMSLCSQVELVEEAESSLDWTMMLRDLLGQSLQELRGNHTPAIHAGAGSASLPDIAGLSGSPESPRARPPKVTHHWDLSPTPSLQYAWPLQPGLDELPYETASLLHASLPRRSPPATRRSPSGSGTALGCCRARQRRRCVCDHSWSHRGGLWRSCPSHSQWFLQKVGTMVQCCPANFRQPAWAHIARSPVALRS